jgi:hypothetical protein
MSDPKADSKPAGGGRDAQRAFGDLVESVGVKRFAAGVGLSTRQVNRILRGAQPNPIERVIRAVQAADPEAGDRALDFICQEMGGSFVRQTGVRDSTVNAIKECAEAIAAMSDGEVSQKEIDEIRDAISALSSLVMSLQRNKPDKPDRRGS